jgi:WD40 repeat protein
MIVASGSGNGVISLWSLGSSSPSALSTLSHGDTEEVYVCMLPSQRDPLTLISGGDNKVHLWDLTTETRLNSLQFDSVTDVDPLGGSARNPSGKTFVFDASVTNRISSGLTVSVALTDGTVRVIDGQR